MGSVPWPWLTADTARSTRESSRTASAAVTLNTSRSRPTVREPKPIGNTGGIASRWISPPVVPARIPSVRQQYDPGDRTAARPLADRGERFAQIAAAGRRRKFGGCCSGDLFSERKWFQGESRTEGCQQIALEDVARGVDPALSVGVLDTHTPGGVDQDGDDGVARLVAARPDDRPHQENRQRNERQRAERGQYVPCDAPPSRTGGTRATTTPPPRRRRGQTPTRVSGWRRPRYFFTLASDS